MHCFAAVRVRAVALERLTGVRSDPDVGRDDLGLERALDADRRLERGLRGRERREEAVAGLLDDLAAGAGDLLFEHLVVPREQLLPLLVAERLEEPCRADDVREEERAPRLLPAEELRGTLGVGLRADPLEGRVRSVEFGDRSVLVAAPAECEPEEDARLCGLERRADLAPLVTRMAKAANRLVRVSLGECDPTRGDVNRGVERRSAAAAELVRGDELLELGERSARRLQVPRRNGDLDLSRKPPDPSERLLGLGERTRDPRDGRVELPFGEVEERKAGLRRGAELVRPRVGLLGGREVAQPATDLADLVVTG